MVLDIKVRFAEKGDIKQLVPLIKRNFISQLDYARTSYDIYNELKEELPKEQIDYLVAEYNNKLIGYVKGSENGINYNGLSLYVDETYRGNGVGHDLKKTIVDLARGHGFLTFNSEVSKKNIPSIKIQEKIGFELVFDEDKIYCVLNLQNDSWRYLK